MSSPPKPAPGRQPFAPPSSLTLGENIRRTLALAVPVMIARAGLVIMVMIDVVMLGHVSTEMLAHYGLSTGPHVTLLVLGIGLMAATTILSAQANGAGRPQEIGAIWRTALLIGLCLGLLEGVVMSFGPDILRLLDQPPELAQPAGEALRMFGWGMPAIFMFLATTNFLEGTGRPQVGMVITLGANGVKLFCNWLLIEGHWGFPAMGAAGATLSTTVIRWVMLGAAVFYVLVLMKDRATYGVRLRGRLPLRVASLQLRLGLPLALSIGIQTAALAFVQNMAGWISPDTAAAYAIANNVIGFVFMLSIGLATATGVRTANAVGRGDRPGRALAGWLGLGMVITLQLVIGGGIALFREPLAGFYTSDSAVLPVVIGCLLLVALMVILDGAHNVMQGALRAGGDVTRPMVIYLVAYWAIGVPLSYVLGHDLGWGAEGLLLGNLLGYLLAAFALTWRFHIVSQREVKPLT